MLTLFFVIAQAGAVPELPAIPPGTMENFGGLVGQVARQELLIASAVITAVISGLRRFFPVFFATENGHWLLTTLPIVLWVGVAFLPGIAPAALGGPWDGFFNHIIFGYALGATVGHTYSMAKRPATAVLRLGRKAPGPLKQPPSASPVPPAPPPGAGG